MPLWLQICAAPCSRPLLTMSGSAPSSDRPSAVDEQPAASVSPSASASAVPTPALTAEQRAAALVRLASMRAEMAALHSEMGGLKEELHEMTAAYMSDMQRALQSVFTSVQTAVEQQQQQQQSQHTPAAAADQHDTHRR